MIIHNQTEFESFYPYDPKYIKAYPKEYPCICKWDNVDGGLMGDYKQMYVAYFPQNISAYEAFIIGLNNPWEILG